LIDRFGELPPQAERLLTAVALRVLARSLAIREVDARSETIRLIFNDSPPLASAKVAALFSAEAGRLRYVPPGTLEYRVNGGDRIALVQSLLVQLLGCR
jgi:transcription-repair coupling factor (superfamily II helicase)